MVGDFGVCALLVLLYDATEFDIFEQAESFDYDKAPSCSPLVTIDIHLYVWFCRMVCIKVVRKLNYFSVSVCENNLRWTSDVSNMHWTIIQSNTFNAIVNLTFLEFTMNVMIMVINVTEMSSKAMCYICQAYICIILHTSLEIHIVRVKNREKIVFFIIGLIRTLQYGQCSASANRRVKHVRFRATLR